MSARAHLISAVRGFLGATMKGWPPEERATLERALVAFEREPTELQVVLTLLKLPPDGHMGDVEGAISRLLDLERAVVAATMALRRVKYKGFSVVEGAQWAAAEIERLTPKVPPPSRGKVRA